MQWLMPQESIPEPGMQKRYNTPPGKILLTGFPNPYPNAKNTPREETATGGTSQYRSIAYK